MAKHDRIETEKGMFTPSRHSLNGVYLQEEGKKARKIGEYKKSSPLLIMIKAQAGRKEHCFQDLSPKKEADNAHGVGVGHGRERVLCLPPVGDDELWRIIRQ